MADNQVEIQVIAKTELSEVEELESVVEDIKSSAEEDITLSVDTSDATSSLEEAETEAETLADDLESIDGQTVSINVDTSGVDEAKASLEETASTADSLTTALAGIGATAAIENMVTTADNINTSWNRLELTFANTGVSIDELKSKTSALSDATGRSGGTIRDYFNQMGIAGVTNTDLITSSFEALSGKAYQTGNSIESMESKMQMMAMTGNASGRMLRQLGIDSTDLAQAMGVSAEQVSEAFKNMTPEQRIAAITKAMGEGTQANEMYKNSYAGLKDRANAAMAGLAGAVGQAILPVVIPALEAATQAIKMLSDGFKALPAPVQGVIGAVLGIVAIGTTLIGTLGVVGKVIGTVKTGLETLGMLGKVTSVISSIGGALSSLWGVLIANPIILVVVAIVALIAALVWAYYNVDWFREMVNNAWASIQGFAAWLGGAFMGAINNLGAAFQNAGQIIQSSIQGAVDFVIGALQNLWNYIMTLGGLIPANASITGNAVIDSILKVMAFMATLPQQIAMYLLNVVAEALGFGENFSQNMIQGAANAVSGFLEWIGQLPMQVEENLAAVVESTVTWLTSLWESITEITLLIAEALAFPFVNIGLIVYESLMTIWSVITGILASVWASISAFGLQLLTTVMTVVTGVITNLQRGIAYFATIPGLIAGYLSQVISRVVSWGASLASNFLSAASKSVSNFGSQIAQIPSRLGSELSSALDKVNEWAATLPAKFWQAGVDAVKNFLSALGIASPGTMQRMLVWEVTEMGKRVPEESKTLLTNVGRLGENIVDEFGEPTLGVKFDDTANANITALTNGQTRANVINLNMEIGSVDNEDRIHEIVEAVRRELAWNNLLAGRTVDDI